MITKYFVLCVLIAWLILGFLKVLTWWLNYRRRRTCRQLLLLSLEAGDEAVTDLLTELKLVGRRWTGTMGLLRPECLKMFPPILIGQALGTWLKNLEADHLDHSVYLVAADVIEQYENSDKVVQFAIGLSYVFDEEQMAQWHDNVARTITIKAEEKEEKAAKSAWARAKIKEEEQRVRETEQRRREAQTQAMGAMSPETMAKFKQRLRLMKKVGDILSDTGSEDDDD